MEWNYLRHMSLAPFDSTLYYISLRVLFLLHRYFFAIQVVARIIPGQIEPTCSSFAAFGAETSVYMMELSISHSYHARTRRNRSPFYFRNHIATLFVDGELPWSLSSLSGEKHAPVDAPSDTEESWLWEDKRCGRILCANAITLASLWGNMRRWLRDLWSRERESRRKDRCISIVYRADLSPFDAGRSVSRGYIHAHLYESVTRLCEVNIE